MRPAGGGQIARECHGSRTASGTVACLVHRLVAIADIADKTERLRLVGGERCAIDSRRDIFRRQLARLGDATIDLPGDRRQQRLDLLALRPRHRGFGKTVHRRFEFLAVLEIRGDAELVEKAAQKWRLTPQAGQANLPQRLQPDLVAGGREVIRPGAGATLAKRIGEGHHEFALGAKRRDRVAHLLGLRQAQRIVAELDVKGFDPRIVGGAVERIDKIAQRCLFIEK